MSVKTYVYTTDEVKELVSMDDGAFLDRLKEMRDPDDFDEENPDYEIVDVTYYVEIDDDGD